MTRRAAALPPRRIPGHAPGSPAAGRGRRAPRWPAACGWLLLWAAAMLVTVPSTRAWTLMPGGTHWAAGQTVTYSFDTKPGGYQITAPDPYTTNTVGDLNAVFPAGWKSEIVAAFAVWEAACNLHFVEVADSGTDLTAGGSAGLIRIAAHAMDGQWNTLAHAFSPSPPLSAGGDLHFDPTEAWFVGPGAPPINTIDLFSVALHELGHSLGLGHEAGTVMDAVYSWNSSRSLTADDITGVQIGLGYGPAALGGTPEPGTLLLLVVLLAVAALVPRPGPVAARPPPG